MRITAERLEAFKKLYSDRFGILLTDEEALDKGLRAIRLMELVYKPMTRKEFDAVKARRVEIINR